MKYPGHVLKMPWTIKEENWEEKSWSNIQSVTEGEHKNTKKGKHEGSNKKRNPELNNMDFHIDVTHEKGSPRYFVMKLKKFADREDPSSFKEG